MTNWVAGPPEKHLFVISKLIWVLAVMEKGMPPEKQASTDPGAGPMVRPIPPVNPFSPVAVTVNVA